MPTILEHLKDCYPTVSLESLIDGIKAQEIEFCMYTEIKNFDELKRKAINVERQEQWLVKIDQERVDGKMRIRLIDNSRPTMCTKIKREGMVGVEEVETDIPIDLYRHLREMAVEGFLKTRYTVPSTIQGLVWEVDVFFNNSGGYHPWVKVDLEVKNINDPIPIFPIEHGQTIFADGELGHSDKMKIKRLWECEYQQITR